MTFQKRLSGQICNDKQLSAWRAPNTVAIKLPIKYKLVVAYQHALGRILNRHHRMSSTRSSTASAELPDALEGRQLPVTVLPGVSRDGSREGYCDLRSAAFRARLKGPAECALNQGFRTTLMQSSSLLRNVS
jgi:hypothetical protein